MLISRRIISVEVPDGDLDKLSEEEQTKLSDRIEELIVNAMYSIETDFDCVFTNNQSTVKLNIIEQ